MIVTAATAGAKDTISATLNSRPDLVILSAQLPGGAIEVLESVRRELPETEFIVMAETADDDFMFRTVAAGARGFLLGETDPARLPDAVAGVLNGEAAFPRKLVRRLADEVARRDPQRRVTGPGGERLTARELAVLDALAEDRSAVRAAQRLGITHATVRTHLSNAMRKLGVATRAEAIESLRSKAGEPRPQGEVDGSRDTA